MSESREIVNIKIQELLGIIPGDKRKQGYQLLIAILSEIDAENRKYTKKVNEILDILTPDQIDSINK